MDCILLIVACLIVMIPAFYLTREKLRKKEEVIEEVSSPEKIEKVEETVKKLNLKELVKENEKVYVLYKGLPYCAKYYYDFSITHNNHIRFYPVDWSGEHCNTEKSFVFLEDMEKDLTLFTPLKEVIREATEEDSPDKMALHKVSAKVRSKYNKTYKIEFDVRADKSYTQKILPDFKKETVETEVSCWYIPHRGTDPTSDGMILHHLREIKGISLLREDVKEIEFKKFERPAKITKTVITYG